MHFMEIIQLYNKLLTTPAGRVCRKEQGDNNSSEHLQ